MRAYAVSKTDTLAEGRMSLFPSVTPPVMKRLLSLKKEQSDDQDGWSDKAIRSLVKRLKKSGGLNDLEAAITNPDKPSKWVQTPTGYV